MDNGYDECCNVTIGGILELKRGFLGIGMIETRISPNFWNTLIYKP